VSIQAYTPFFIVSIVRHSIAAEMEPLPGGSAVHGGKRNFQGSLPFSVFAFFVAIFHLSGNNDRNCSLSEGTFVVHCLF
jgi:hypothetical protein